MSAKIAVGVAVIAAHDETFPVAAVADPVGGRAALGAIAVDRVLAVGQGGQVEIAVDRARAVDRVDRAEIAADRVPGAPRVLAVGVVVAIWATGGVKKAPGGKSRGSRAPRCRLRRR